MHRYEPNIGKNGMMPELLQTTFLPQLHQARFTSRSLKSDGTLIQRTQSSKMQNHMSELSRTASTLVFKGPVYRTNKRPRTEPNRHIVWSIFWLRLPRFGTSSVAGCLDSKILENHLKTGCYQLQPVFSQYIKYYR